MMRFQVFLSLWSVKSCLYIDKIPNIYAKKEGGTIIPAVVLLLPPALCPGDTVFHL